MSNTAIKYAEPVVKQWVEVPSSVYLMASNPSVQYHNPHILRNMLKLYGIRDTEPLQVQQLEDGQSLPCLEFEDIIILRSQDA